MTNAIPELDHTDLIFNFGYNPATSHPLVSEHIIQAKKNGAKIITVDPRIIETSRIADLHVPIRNGANIAFLNAMMNVIIEEGLQDQDFIDNHTDGYDEWYEVIKKYTPENTQEITGIDPEMTRECARMYATAPTATICWGMGVTQWTSGVRNVMTLASLALITGNLGKPHVGCNPVRGQNNVQGSCDMGMLPGTYPGYQSVFDPAVREKFAKAWGVPVENLSDRPGFSLSDIPHAVESGKLKAFYCFGEDPAQTDPHSEEIREALDNLELLIVQDIVVTQTAMHADVVFPATTWGEHTACYTAADRSFQLSEQALPPKGECKHDWEIFSLMAQGMGYDMHYESTQEIWDEVRLLSPKFMGCTYEKMREDTYAQWPILEEGGESTSYLYDGGVFPTNTGKGHLIASEWVEPDEKLSDEFPLILSTVREVGHYSARTMTGNCKALSTLGEEPGNIQINPADAETRGIADGDLVWVQGARGKVVSRAAVDERVNEGAVYMTYHWWIGKCNELSNAVVDPESKTPEYKWSAVQVELIENQEWAEKYVVEEYAALRQKLFDAVPAAEGGATPESFVKPEMKLPVF